VAQLVAHSLWERGVASSSLAAPTIFTRMHMTPSKKLSHILAIFQIIFLLTTASSTSALENTILSTIVDPIKKANTYLNEFETTLDIPHHTISCILGAAALIATPFIIIKTYNLLEKCFLDNKPDSYIIKRTNTALKKINHQFLELFHYLETINTTHDNEKITAKFFFKEKILTLSQGKHPFADYITYINKAITTIAREQRILDRRISFIKKRSTFHEISNEVDNDCVIILSTIAQSFELLLSKLHSLKQEIINSFEYRTDLAQEQSQSLIKFLQTNILLLYLFLH
jgi:hypothetical protein